MGRPIKEGSDSILEVNCPNCPARVGMRCKTETGRELPPMQSHIERIRKSPYKWEERAEAKLGQVQHTPENQKLKDALLDNEPTVDREPTARILKHDIEDQKKLIEHLNDRITKQALIITRLTSICEPTRQELDSVYEGLDAERPTAATVIEHFHQYLNLLDYLIEDDKEAAKKYREMFKIMNTQ